MCASSGLAELFGSNRCDTYNPSALSGIRCDFRISMFNSYLRRLAATLNGESNVNDMKLILGGGAFGAMFVLLAWGML